MSPFTHSRTARLLRGAFIALLILAALLYLGLPTGMAVFAVLPGRAAVGSPPAGFEPVDLQTSDGVALKAWYHPPENGAAVILAHGAGSSRAGTRVYAEMLAQNGYGVLALDLRGHGESAGRTNRLGWQGSADIGAAVTFLRGRSEVNAIGGLGLSMGGEVLLGAAADYPEIQAIIADGATRRSTAELLALESERPLVRNFTARVMYAAVQLLSGQAPPRPLLESMKAAGSTRFLFIAGGDVPLEVAFNRLFADTLGERASLWVAPGAGHIGAFAAHPQEYQQLVIAFFETNLPARPFR